MRPFIAIFAVLVTLLPGRASAHDGRVTPETWHTAWNADLLVLFTLGLVAWLYARGRARRRRIAARNGMALAQATAFFASLLLIAVALLSPLDALSNELSSFHMVQHMLLIAVAAPLLVVSSPAAVIAAGLSERRRGPAVRLIRSMLRLGNAPLLWNALFVWTLFAAALWVWHQPAAYQAALADPLVHDAQHLSFFIAAFLYWRMCLDPLARRRLSALVAVPYLLATSVHAAVLGVFLALAPTVWYDAYESRTAVWGLSPLEDQQLAGLLMWMPACLVYPLAAAVRFQRWLSRHAVEPSTARTWSHPTPNLANR